MLTNGGIWKESCFLIFLNEMIGRFARKCV